MLPCGPVEGWYLRAPVTKDFVLLEGLNNDCVDVAAVSVGFSASPMGDSFLFFASFFFGSNNGRLAVWFGLSRLSLS